MQKNILFPLLSLVFLLAACGIAANSRSFDPSITKDSHEIFKNEDVLFSYVKKFGPKQTITQLHQLTALYGNCHDAAHKAGHFAYEIYKEKAFKECSAECHSGCYHGATEAYFRDHGTAKLAENLKVICSSELNPFFSHQCLHGIGHGLMAWTDYEMFEALKSCDLLPERKDSCWTGVFMENIVGTLGKDKGHSTKYLSQDPQFPCPIVDDKYKSSCYFLQTSRMIQLFGTDFKKIAQACSKAPNLYQRVCFASMGRDIGGTLRGNLAAKITACFFAPKGEMRIECLNGAVQDAFWDPSGADTALSFCKVLKDKKEKEACYSTIIGRAPQILTTKEDFKSFCEKVELPYRASCTPHL